MTCEDCKGSGKYVGLIAVEACRSCGGSGWKNANIWGLEATCLKLQILLPPKTVGTNHNFFVRDADGERNYGLEAVEGSFKVGDEHPVDEWAKCRGDSLPWRTELGNPVYLFTTRAHPIYPSLDKEELRRRYSRD